ncbi:MAG: hypothetical protein HY660_07160 [Armatimonadetes bacterium]|nr:hypothetical protein [Armatimonadota bacterium]
MAQAARKESEREPYVRTSIRLPQGLAKLLGHTSVALRRSQNQLIVEAIERYLGELIGDELSPREWKRVEEGLAQVARGEVVRWRDIKRTNA